MRRFTFLALILLVLASLVFNTMPGKAAPAAADRGAWAPNVAYAVNDTVTYNGQTYKCLQAHTSLTGWEPSNVPALWQAVAGGPTSTFTNTPTKTVTPTVTIGVGVDLIVVSVTLGNFGPTCANNLRHNVTVKNQGTAAAGSFVVAYSYNNQTQTVSGLAAGQSVVVQFTPAYMTQSTATVDSTSLIAETNENNNFMVAQLPSPTAAPSCTPTSTISPTPSKTFTPSPTSTIGGGSCSGIPQYVAGTAYIAGQVVQNVGNKYTCSIAGWCSSSAAWAYAPGTGTYWTDAWTLSGACSGGTNTPTATRTITTTPTGTPGTLVPSLTPSITPTSGGSTCAVQSVPTGKVLVGYWETWDGSSTHPGAGHFPLSQTHANYNVINVAFPVIQSDGTLVFQDGMAPGEDVPTPAEVCAEKAKGRRVLLSIGGAAAAIDLSQRTVAQRFIDTAVPILKTYNFDGIDIDIEAGLVAGANYNTLSTSQANLIFIIDGILAQMPSNFMLTMAPETAYVTGGQISYGGPWGAYLPIIGKYRDNGRLSYLNMQYYNGSMYGCPGGVATTYNPGTVDGFVEQTKCINNGFQAGGVTFSLPYSKQVPGLPAQIGAASSGYMTPAQVDQAYALVSQVKGFMTWSINWDASKAWTFAINNLP